MQELTTKKPAMFLPRWEYLPDIDLYMDQVIILLEKYLGPFLQRPREKFITASMVNNYVKQGIIPAPVKKRYSRSHLAYLIMVVSLKQIFSMEEINRLLSQELLHKQIDEVYNEFCSLQEQAFIQVLQEAKGGNERASALELSVLANAGKILVVRMLEGSAVIPVNAEADNTKETP